MKIYRSLRFRLTVWYSFLLITLSAVFVLTINALVANYYHRTQFEVELISNSQFNQFLEDGSYEDIRRDKVIELVSAIRRDDLETIRFVSGWLFLVLAILSFVGGYIIAGQIFAPVSDLNAQIRKVKAENLEQEIEFESRDDEIGELVDTINHMFMRLKHSFSLQRQFIENASHELKTPIAIVRTNLDAILLDQSTISSEILENIHSANRSVEFMGHLIDDLTFLSLSKEHIQFEKGDITEVVKRAVASVNPLAKTADINIRLEIPKKKIYKMISNSLLERAIMNLLENAIKFSSQGSKVEVRVRQEKERVYISIQDHGEGIPKEALTKIFERFYRVDKSRSRKTGGRGLGLAITRTIVEMHQGIIRVNSQLHKGSTFTIILI
jgi:signal transduction histidine kinase